MAGVGKRARAVVEIHLVGAAVADESIEITVAVHVAQHHGIAEQGRGGVRRIGKRAGPVVLPHRIGLPRIGDEGVDVAVAVQIAHRDIGAVGCAEALRRIGENTDAVVGVDLVALARRIGNDHVQIAISVHIAKRDTGAGVDAQALAGIRKIAGTVVLPQRVPRAAIGNHGVQIAVAVHVAERHIRTVRRPQALRRSAEIAGTVVYPGAVGLILIDREGVDIPVAVQIAHGDPGGVQGLGGQDDAAWVVVGVGHQDVLFAVAVQVADMDFVGPTCADAQAEQGEVALAVVDENLRRIFRGDDGIQIAIAVNVHQFAVRTGIPAVRVLAEDLAGIGKGSTGVVKKHLITEVAVESKDIQIAVAVQIAHGNIVGRSGDCPANTI